MDIALCKIDIEKRKIQYSGANRPLWIVRKELNEVEVIIPTKAAIGGSTDNEQKFDLQNIQLKEGDSFFIFSDGYADSFDKLDKKRMKSRRFKELLLQIKHKSMAEQEVEIINYFNDWRGDVKQVDDILVIGIRL
jgi:serine phosphatase RsbU (regulator of sigma subunit)